MRGGCRNCSQGRAQSSLNTHTPHVQTFALDGVWSSPGPHAPHERGLAQAQGSLVAIRDTWASWLPARPLGFRVHS